jgi:LysM repeat protein
LISFSEARANKAIFTLYARLLTIVTKKIKGFHRNPFFYLIAVAIVLLVWVSFVNNVSKESNSLNLIGLSAGQLSRADIKTNELFIMSGAFQPESPDFSLIQKNSLLGAAPPITVTPQVLGAILGESNPVIKREIIEYQAQAGDNLSVIAEKFGISLDTLIWANNLTQNSLIKIGQKLIILPISGVIHYVKSGDTISGIAKKYKASADDIVVFNELVSQNDIFIGDILIVPNGTIPPQPKPVYVQDIPVASSYFICPIASPCRVTQGLHFYNAVDFSHGKCGDSIYAAAGGTVQRVKYGWNGGAGNTITILHPNGVVTSYGHLLVSFVNPGDQVYQGQIIAQMGGQPGAPGAGKSTGCHIHFGVQGARNPFAR